MAGWKITISDIDPGKRSMNMVDFRIVRRVMSVQQWSTTMHETHGVATPGDRGYEGHQRHFFTALGDLTAFQDLSMGDPCVNHRYLSW